jgi:hypothetical protein
MFFLCYVAFTVSEINVKQGVDSASSVVYPSSILRRDEVEPLITSAQAFLAEIL